jgi:PAS domain S-box-containing protein
MLILIATVFFIYLNVYLALIFFLLSFTSLALTLSLTGQLNDNAYTFLYTAFPTVIIAIFISSRNYSLKKMSLFRMLENEELTEELMIAQEQLRKEVSVRNGYLKESEEKFRNFVENANDIIYQMDLDGTLTYVSPNWKEVLGYDIEEVTGEMAANFTHEDDIPQCQAFMDDVVRSGKKRSGLEYRVKHKDGNWRWHRTNGSPLIDENGTVYSYLGVARDVTEQKLADIREREIHRINEATLNSIDSLLVVLDRKQRIILSNWKDYEWVPRNDRESRPLCTEVMKDLFEACPECSVMDVFIDGKQRDYEGVQLGEEKYIDIKVIPVFKEDNEVEYVLLKVNDVSQKRKNQNALIESEQQKSMILESPQELLTFYDSDLKIKWANQASSNALHISQEDIVGRSYFEVWEKFIQPGKDFPLVKVKKTHDPQESQIELNDGRFFHLRVHPVRDDLGELRGFIEFGQDVSERVLTEKRVIELNRRYQAIMSNFPNGGVFLIDSSFRYLHANGSAMESMNLNPAEIIGKRVEEVFPPEVSDVVKKNEPRIFEGQNCYFEIKFRDRIFANWGVPVRDRQGIINEGVIYALDITELKHHERKIQEASDRFSALVNHLQSGVFYINTKGEILELNPAMLKILGSPSEEFTKSINLLDFPPLVETGYSEKLRHCMATGEIIFGEAEYTSAWGKNSIVNFYFVPVKENGKVIGVISNNEDVTEKRKAEEKLIFQSVLLDSINDYIIATDLEGEIVYTNQKVNSVFGIQQDDNNKININAFGSMENEGASQKEITAETKKNGEWRGEVINYTKDGQRLVLESRTQLLTDFRGNPYGMVGISTDITLKKQQEKQLEDKNLELKLQNKEYRALNEQLVKANENLNQAIKRAEESDHLKTMFLNNMSHEVRTPMNGIIGFSEFLANEDLSDEKRKYYSKLIVNSSEQLLKIVDDILEISSLETKQTQIHKTRFYLNELLNELHSIFAIEAKKRKIPLQLRNGNEGEPLLINTDRVKLHKILSNLLENAFKFTSRGSVEFGFEIEDENLRIYVSDTGIGILPENKELIFKRFTQEEKELSRREGGLGIGLSIVKENAILLDGDIELESEKGKGSVFSLILSADIIEQERRKTSPKNPPEKSSYSGHILIAEDEDINYLYLETILQETKNFDFQWTRARNGEEVVEMVKNKEEIDLILMDIKMPVKDGLEATREVKELRADIPVLAQTAYSTQLDISKILDAGCDDYLIKPIERDDLVRKISEQLFKSQMV